MDFFQELQTNYDTKDDTIKIVEMHTCGEPVRIVVRGYPPIKGSTILEKRRYVQKNLDYLRKRVIFEPRGHKDQYGVILIQSKNESGDNAADIGVLFMHNEGYSTMCGHATIALGRFLIDSNILNLSERSNSDDGQVRINIECPCGIVPTFVDTIRLVNGRLQARSDKDVKFHSVPSFAVAIDVSIEFKGRKIKFDIGFGGAFYIIISVKELLELNSEILQEDYHKIMLEKFKYITELAGDLTEKCRNSKEFIQKYIIHPDNSKQDLNFLYGTIVTNDTYNICIFADREIDRSPCGSGVSARVALQYAKGTLPLDKTCYYQSMIGNDKFSGKVIKPLKLQGSRNEEIQAVIVEVGGKAYYTSVSTLIMEKDDSFQEGFLLPN
jgi:trans-L-3-hydroxyproline dehydratase